MKIANLKVGSKIIGHTKPVFIIAEAGVNHNGSLKLAKQLIDAAAAAGADAVKFQTFNPETLVVKNAAKAGYQIKNENRKAETQYQMLKRLTLKREHHAELKNYAEKKGLVFLSTPFSFDDAKFLRGLGVGAIKVGSSDTNNFPYLARIARWKLPIILSSGMSDLSEIQEAVKTIKAAGNNKIIILHCTTNYPTPFSEANLKVIPALQKQFGILIGLSDHTLMAEKLILASYYYQGNKKTKFSCVRFGNVLGSRGSILPLLKKQIFEKGTVTITDPAMTRFVMTIPQAVNLVLSAAAMSRGQEIFILKMPAAKLGNLVKAAIEYYAPLAGKRPSDIKIQNIGRRDGEKDHESLLANHEISRVLETKDMYILTPYEKVGNMEYEKIYPGAAKIRRSSKGFLSEHAPKLSQSKLTLVIKEIGY